MSPLLLLTVESTGIISVKMVGMPCIARYSIAKRVAQPSADLRDWQTGFNTLQGSHDLTARKSRLLYVQPLVYGTGLQAKTLFNSRWASHVHTPEVVDRQFPDHLEGDLNVSTLNQSAVGTLVERNTLLLILVKLPQPNPAAAAHVLQTFTDKLNAVAQPTRRTLGYDRDKEMRHHQVLSAKRQDGHCGIF